MNKKLLLHFIALFVSLIGSTVALAQGKNRWAGFYDRQTLAYWQTQTPPGIEENFREEILPRLTAEERRALADVVLLFPLENGEHPMNFKAGFARGKKIIEMPISSLRFFGDVALAYTWLQAKGYSTDPVTDYLTMLKYQWPGRLAGSAYRPLEVLGIPQNVRSDAKVMEKYYGIYKTAIYFGLCHELGHHYQWQTGARHLPTSVEQERRADRFALDMMSRVGAVPVGVPFFFVAAAHLETNDGDAEYLEKPSPTDARQQATHPVTADRLKDLASLLMQQSGDFTRMGTPAKTIGYLVDQINDIAKVVSDSGLQFLLQRRGFTARPELLGPRRLGELFPESFHAIAASSAPYSGIYRAKWSTTTITSFGGVFDGVMLLTRSGKDVYGIYTFGVEGVSGGYITIKGTVYEGQLFFQWGWGPNYHGQGVLTTNAAGNALAGNWGNNKENSGAGQWQLERMN